MCFEFRRIAHRPYANPFQLLPISLVFNELVLYNSAAVRKIISLLNLIGVFNERIYFFSSSFCPDLRAVISFQRAL